MDNCYQVIEEGGTFREFPKSHEGLENAIECAWENCTDVVWKHDDVAETIWSIDNVEIAWNEDQFNSDADAGYVTDEDYLRCDASFIAAAIGSH